SLISWGSVFAGAVIAVVTGAMLNVLGVAIGVTAMEPGDPSGAGAGSLTVFGGLWIAISTVIGLLAGGYVAARAAANPDHHDGALHGAAVWAVSFLLALFLTGSFVSGTAMSAIQAAGNAAEAVRSPGAAANTAGDTARNAAGAVRDDTGRDTPAEARAEEAADRAADAAAGTAFWAFITMLASLVAAMIGGGFGARSDHGHRPRRDYADVI
ncbi:MAG TPA: hypothetical protein VF699_08795, partial [Caulobacteraceae bacterium]